MNKIRLDGFTLLVAFAVWACFNLLSVVTP